MRVSVSRAAVYLDGNSIFNKFGEGERKKEKEKEMIISEKRAYAMLPMPA